MQSFTETQNIVHFKRLLETETHPDKRKILLQLLAEEQVKLIAHVKAEHAQNWRARKSDMSNPSTDERGSSLTSKSPGCSYALDN
jgi:hypothetical protein